jgi:hypothetical protein
MSSPEPEESISDLESAETRGIGGIGQQGQVDSDGFDREVEPLKSEKVPSKIIGRMAAMTRKRIAKTGRRVTLREKRTIGNVGWNGISYQPTLDQMQEQADILRLRIRLAESRQLENLATGLRKYAGLLRAILVNNMNMPTAEVQDYLNTIRLPAIEM